MRYHDIIQPFYYLLRCFLFLTWLQRNYRFFYLFISTSTILCIYVFVISLINILHHGGNVWRAISQDILSDVLIVYCFIAVWFVGGLSIFHFYLISTNQVISLTKMYANRISYGSSVMSSEIWVVLWWIGIFRNSNLKFHIFCGELCLAIFVGVYCMCWFIVKYILQ